MSDIAIRVENLSKRYRIGQRERYKALRDVITDAFAAPFRRLRRTEDGGRKTEAPSSVSGPPSPVLRPQSSVPSQDSYIWALKDISFEVKRGEVVGIIGRNGAGKSTLLKVLSRITKPTEGRAVVSGRVGSLLEVGTGFHPELTGRENIYLNGAILGMRRAEIDRKFDEIVAFAEVERFIDTPVKHYSSGMYVRLAFAVAAHLEPEILLVDEVLAVGDAAFQKKCLGKMGDVAKEGRTVVFVSHNMAAVENLCGKAILLIDGRLDCLSEVRLVIRKYLQAISVSSSSADLLNRPSVRPGKTRIRFTHFHIEDEARNRTGTVQSGQNIVLVFAFSCLDEDRPKNVGVGFGIHGSNNERLAVLYTWYTDQDFKAIPPRGEFRCRIPRFPFAPGRYFVYPRIEIDNQEADFPQDGVGFIDVEPGDFFGTGRTIGDRGNAPFLLAGTWSVIPSCQE